MGWHWVGYFKSSLCRPGSEAAPAWELNSQSIDPPSASHLAKCRARPGDPPPPCLLLKQAEEEGFQRLQELLKTRTLNKSKGETQEEEGTFPPGSLSRGYQIWSEGKSESFS